MRIKQVEKLKLDYHFVSAGQDDFNCNLEKAFDLLFESVLEDYKLKEIKNENE